MTYLVYDALCSLGHLCIVVRWAANVGAGLSATGLACPPSLRHLLNGVFSHTSVTPSCDIQSSGTYYVAM